ncbi:MAG: hypothetical protein HS100_14970 [Anaerolineales bacterium]|nr:hypothetical protein [Anaerolineales bacterium]
MKRIIIVFLGLCLTSCDIWGVAPQPFPVLSPPPTNTPPIFTATPFIIPPPTLNFTVTPVMTSSVPISPTPSETASPTLSPTFAPPSATNTLVPFPSVAIEILGCNTSIDIQNGMGEVTNAYVVVKNTGNVDLPNTCGLLRANDEGRVHPDKKSCVSNLPVQNQVTLKLTVDSTYKTDTIIQVDGLSNEVVLLRIDKQSCRDIQLFGGIPADVGVVKPIP